MDLLKRIARGMDALAGREYPLPAPEAEATMPELDAPPPEPVGPQPFPEGYVPTEAEYLDVADGRMRLIVMVDHNGAILPVRWVGGIGPMLRPKLASMATTQLIDDATTASSELLELQDRQMGELQRRIAELTARLETHYGDEL